MAQGQLPLYYKNSRPVGPVSTKTKWSEYYLLVVTLFGFLMLFAGVLWFVPIIDADDGYTKAYGGFTGTEPMTSGSMGTESIYSPISVSLGNVTPTSRPKGSWNHTSVSGHKNLTSVESKLSHEVPSKVISSHDSSTVQRNVDRDDINTMRRNKVVQVIVGSVWIAVSCMK